MAKVKVLQHQTLGPRRTGRSLTRVTAIHCRNKKAPQQRDPYGAVALYMVGQQQSHDLVTCICIIFGGGNKNDSPFQRWC